MANIEIYTKDWCSFCKGAKSLLNQKGLKYVELDVTHNHNLETEMQNRSNRRSVPQIFIDGNHIGGSDDLRALSRRGDLDGLTSEGSRDKKVTRLVSPSALQTTMQEFLQTLKRRTK